MTKRAYSPPRITDHKLDLLCEVDDCDNYATTRYRFPWGDEGTVCDDHRFIKQQLATQQLNTTIAFAPLGPSPEPAAPPVNTSALEHTIESQSRKIEELEAHNSALQKQVADLSAQAERLLAPG